jgi:hypothetical protein
MVTSEQWPVIAVSSQGVDRSVNSNDLWALFIGAFLSLIGLRMLTSRGFVDFRFGYIDFGPYHHFIGIFVLCVGASIVFAILRKFLRS